MELKEGDLVEATKNCGDVKKGQIYTVQKSKFQQGKICIGENTKKNLHCSCSHTWKKVDSIPEKWYVKVQEFTPDILKYLEDKYGKLEYPFINEYILSDTNNTYENPSYVTVTNPTTQGYEEITLEQFKKYIMKETKKIIGYKAPMQMYGGNIKAGDVVFPHEYRSNAHTINGKTAPYFLPKELILNWEPVYEQDDIYLGKWKVNFVPNGVAVGCPGHELKYTRKTIQNILEILEIGAAHNIQIHFGETKGNADVKITQEICDKILARL
jgi:hypothetical protein